MRKALKVNNFQFAQALGSLSGRKFDHTLRSPLSILNLLQDEGVLTLPPYEGSVVIVPDRIELLSLVHQKRKNELKEILVTNEGSLLLMADSRLTGASALFLAEWKSYGNPADHASEWLRRMVEPDIVVKSWEGGFILLAPIRSFIAPPV